MHCWLPLGKTLASSTSSTIQSRMLNNKLESFIAIEISTILEKTDPLGELQREVDDVILYNWIMSSISHDWISFCYSLGLVFDQMILSFLDFFSQERNSQVIHTWWLKTITILSYKFKYLLEIVIIGCIEKKRWIVELFCSSTKSIVHKFLITYSKKIFYVFSSFQYIKRSRSNKHVYMTFTFLQIEMTWTFLTCLKFF